MPSRKLAKYRAKRNFSKTAEPSGGEPQATAGHAYLIQKHAARRLHYDFRLELDGTLKSWAVTKGPSLNPTDKRLAVHVEDHPLAYGDFEGTIPKGEYGGGTVMLWDQGSWSPIGDAEKGYKKGKLDFELHGKRLKGRWHLVRMHGNRRGDEKRENWLLIKGKDQYANEADGDAALEEYQSSIGNLRTRHLRQHEDGGGDHLRRQGSSLQSSLPADVQSLPGRSGRLHTGIGLGEGSGREPGWIRPRAVLHAAAALQDLDELNAWLLDQCIAYAKAHHHPELTEQTIWEVFEAERPKLVPYAGKFDGFHAVPASVSKTCLVRFDNNKYSVAASAVGRPVEVHAYADRIVIRQDGRIVAEHPRSFGRGDTIYDPWHYVPVLARKPGALRNGAPFKDWVLPAAMERVRRKLAGADDGNRQMVDILTAVLTDGLPAVEAACAEAIAQGVHSADVVLNILARHRNPGPPATILTPAALTLRHAPIADCARYDNLRRTI